MKVLAFWDLGLGWVVIDDLLDFQGAKCYVHTLKESSQVATVSSKLSACEAKPNWLDRWIGSCALALADMHPHLHSSFWTRRVGYLCSFVLVGCLVNKFLIVFL